jgi:putative transcriptional regulator
MRCLLFILAICCCVIPDDSTADEKPATGKLLVATDEVRGSSFFQTVILLLHYDESGALGLVINRPTEATPDELLPELEGIKDYAGTTYWGGPVRLATMRALHRTDSPTEDEIFVLDMVYQMPLDELPTGEKNQQNLRFFVGYAGWSPGQLDREILFGSWDIIQATEETVFTDDADTIWETLSPPQSYRASAE